MMSRLTGEHWPSVSRASKELHGMSRSAREHFGISKSQTMWLAAGLVAVGVGIVTWSYLGPDLRRYLKIHSM